MGQQRRQRKKQRTRREIFDAAMALLAERAADDVTVAQICEAADVARGTFFLHFPSKAALLEEHERLLGDALAARLATARGSVAGEYRMLVDGLAAEWLGRPGLVRALLPVLLARPGRLQGVVEAVVRGGQRRGELRRSVAPALAARAFLATVAAALGSPAAAPDAEELRNQLLHVLLSGLREPKPRLKWRPSPSPAVKSP